MVLYACDEEPVRLRIDSLRVGSKEEFTYAIFVVSNESIEYIMKGFGKVCNFKRVGGAGRLCLSVFGWKREPWDYALSLAAFFVSVYSGN